MGKLVEIPIFFVSVESLISIYKYNETIDLKNIGIVVGKRSIICQILYKEKELIKAPYGLKVNKDSYITFREKIVKYVIDTVITKYQLGLKDSTINGLILNITHFVNWLNINDLELDKDISSAIHILREYTVFLKGQIRNNSQSTTTSANKQSDVCNMLYEIYNDKKNILGNSVSFITRKKTIEIKTEKSLEEEQQYHYQFYYNMFHQMADFILENKSFPYQIQLVEKKYWCIPSRKLFYRKSDINYPYPFDKDTGNLKTVDTIVQNYNIQKRSADNQLKSFKKTLDLENRHQSRRKFFMASYGLKAFYILFLANTGMNDSTASTLKWNNEYKIEKKRHKFKNIKYRAGNKLVEFEIGSSFVEDFQKFLKLRDYLLCQKEFEYLFFLGYEDTVSLSPRQRQGSFSSVISRKFKKYVDEDLPIIVSRQLRVNKTYQTIKKHGIIVASQTAQTSINTLIGHYQGTTNEIVENELESYFNTLNEKLENKEENHTETVVGWCNNFDNPKQMIKLPDVLMGCQSKEGCLFCENYRIHMDKQDINKLYSLKFIINECKYIAKSEEHFNSIYGVVLDRINNIFELIISKKIMTREQMDKLNDDVFESENLHPYWEHKLNTLLLMGVLK